MWGADRRRWGRYCGGGCVCGAWGGGGRVRAVLVVDGIVLG